MTRVCDGPRNDAVGHLVHQTGEWLSRLWTNDTLSAFSARMGYHVRANAEPTPERMRTILPGHWIVHDATYNVQLLEWIVTALPPGLLPATKLACVGFSLVHGPGWRHDPQYHQLVHMVSAAHDPADLAAAICVFYGEIA